MNLLAASEMFPGRIIRYTLTSFPSQRFPVADVTAILKSVADEKFKGVDYDHRQVRLK